MIPLLMKIVQVLSLVKQIGKGMSYIKGLFNDRRNSKRRETELHD